MFVFRRLVWLAGCLATLGLGLWMMPLEARPLATPATTPPVNPVYLPINSRTDGAGTLALTNLSILGANACIGHGDPFSPLNSPWEPGLYTYLFAVRVPADYEAVAGTSHIRVELLDPDSMNTTAATGSSTVTAVHTQLWVNSGIGRPASIQLACPSSGSQNDQKNTCATSTGELQNNCTVDQQNDPTIFCVEDVDLINPYWFVRMDENRGAGTPPGNNSCGQPSSYTTGFNTQTEYELYYFQQNPDSTLVRTDLALYTGQTGDGRDFDAPGSHGTDLKWVAPGGFNDFGAVPTDCGSQTGGYLTPANPTRCPLLPGHTLGEAMAGTGNGFEIDLAEDMVNVATEAGSGVRYIYLGITTVSGASENGFSLWAGPPSESLGVPADANLRNVWVADNPNQRSAAGVQVLAVNYLPMQATATMNIAIPLTDVPATAGGETLAFSIFDTDTGTQPPLRFDLNTLSPDQFSVVYGITNPDPEGRCFTTISSCNNRWVGPPGTESPPFTVTLPLSLTQNSTLMANYVSGRGDTYVWYGVRPPQPPNLAVGQPQLLGMEPLVANSPLTFTVRITNTGPTAAITTPFAVDLFINPSTIFSTSIPLEQSNGSAVLANLEVGGTQVVTITAPLGVADIYVDNTVCAMVDSTLVIEEINETNNIACITLAAQSPPPDLTIGQPELVTTRPLSATAPLSFTVRITNTGTVSISSAFFVDLFLNPSMVFSTSIPLEQSSGYAALANLEAGATQVVTITAPLGLADVGVENTVCMMVDSTLTVEESNETNNIACITLPSEPPPLPDLTIGQPELVTTRPLSATAPLSFTVRITNTGTVSISSAFFVDLFLNPSTVFSTSIPLEQSSGYAALANLAAGATQVVTITAPQGLADVGVENMVCMMVDSNLTVEESNETNNIVCFTLASEPPPPPPATPRHLYLPLVVAQP